MASLRAVSHQHPPYLHLRRHSLSAYAVAPPECWLGGEEEPFSDSLKSFSAAGGIFCLLSLEPAWPWWLDKIWQDHITRFYIHRKNTQRKLFGIADRMPQCAAFVYSELATLCVIILLKSTDVYLKHMHVHSYLTLCSLMSCKPHLENKAVILVTSAQCQYNKSYCKFYFHWQSL